jgi:hypothetical protein
MQLKAPNFEVKERSSTTKVIKLHIMTTTKRDVKKKKKKKEETTKTNKKSLIQMTFMLFFNNSYVITQSKTFNSLHLHPHVTFQIHIYL